MYKDLPFTEKMNIEHRTSNIEFWMEKMKTQKNFKEDHNYVDIKVVAANHQAFTN